MKFLISSLVLVSLVGCGASANKMNLLSIGMTKQEVVSAMGNPTDTRATQETEYLVYRLRTGAVIRENYFVKLTDGKVLAYGKIGDFGSTGIPEATININKTTKELE